MRPLARNEQRLLVIFAAAVFVALNLFAIRAWTDQRASLARRITDAKSTLSTGKSWISAADTLETAKAWIEANPPPSTRAEEASTRLLNLVRSQAESHSLRIAEESLLPPERSSDRDSVVLQTKLNGPFPGVARFLFELQKPADWRTVDKIAIRSDAEPPNVVVDLQIRQFYRAETPPSGAESE
jgi:hypothetical protein